MGMPSCQGLYEEGIPIALSLSSLVPEGPLLFTLPASSPEFLLTFLPLFSFLKGKAVCATPESWEVSGGGRDDKRVRYGGGVGWGGVEIFSL